MDLKNVSKKSASDAADWTMNPCWLDALPAGIAFFNLSQQITWVNRSYAMIMRVAADDLVGSAFGDVEGVAFDSYRCPVSELMETGRAVSAEMSISHPPDGQKQYSVKVSPVRNGTGELLGAAASIELITDRKTIEKALLKSEMRLREAQRLARIGSWELDLRQNQLYWSDEIYNIFEIDPKRFEATYESFLDVVHPDDRHLVNDAYTRSIHNDEPYEVTHRLLMRDGRIRYVHEKGKTFFDRQGKPIRSIGTVWDITERKLQEEENLNLQKQYHQSQRMETVGRLAGGVAHDFNNMLSVILGRTDLLLQQMTPENSAYQSLVEVQHAAERSAELIRHLLAFSRRQTTKPVYLNLNDVVSGMMKMLYRLIGEQIDLEWLPAENLGTIKMDPSQLEQIMANLCVNARDAIDGVGHITIETLNVSFDEEQCVNSNRQGAVPGDYVMLAVSDDGCGMNDELQQKIFEPFFTTKQKGEGTGLGLATVFGVVKQNGAFINVYSEPGAGTTFKIYFARHYVDAVEVEEKKRRTLPRGNGEVILLVEDEAMVLEVGKTILERLNYRVLPANSPSEAIECIKKATNTKIALLITDVIMPEMNGAELATIIQEMLPGIRTLFTSAYTANVVSRHGVLKPGVDFLQKPVPREVLALKVDEMIRGVDDEPQAARYPDS